MKPLFSQFRPGTAGLSVREPDQSSDAPASHEPPVDPADGAVLSDRSRTAQTDRAPYAVRLRVILALALFSWAVVALLVWAILRF